MKHNANMNQTEMEIFKILRPKVPYVQSEASFEEKLALKQSDDLHNWDEYEELVGKRIKDLNK